VLAIVSCLEQERVPEASSASVPTRRLPSGPPSPHVEGDREAATPTAAVTVAVTPARPVSLPLATVLRRTPARPAILRPRTAGRPTADSPRTATAKPATNKPALE
jgi:Flp pilus assembly protein TadG